MNNHEQTLMHDTITLSRRMAHLMLALTLFFFFVAFMIGYFLGVKYATDEFVTQIRQDTFADQLLVATARQRQAPQEQQTESTTGETQELVNADQVPVVAVVDTVAPAPVEQIVTSVVSAPENPTRYAAELVGFGNKQTAEEFMRRVALYSTVPLELKEHKSKSPRGRAIRWYQVVTGKYEQKEELQTILDILIKKEHLHDVKVVAYAATKRDIA